MILIADSGSTKADWILGQNGKVISGYSTKGFNPFFHDRNFILAELNANSELSQIRRSIQELYFFGAGCSSPERNRHIQESLQEFFESAEIVVEHDMLGTALAVCDGKPGVACILGTGSNICYFNGTDIEPIHHGLGYILGDEGSGSYFGRKLLAWYIYGILPPELAERFRDAYHPDKEQVVKQIYQEKNPNVFLASFAPFLTENRAHPFITELIETGIAEYFKTNVLSYPQSMELPVHAVGSIAWHFRDVFEATAWLHGIKTGTIIHKPVTGLAEYFLSGGKMPHASGVDSLGKKL